MPAFSRRQSFGIAIAFLIAGAALALRLLIDRPLGGGFEFRFPDPGIAQFRFNAIQSGAAIGASLALAGVMLQALLRNPLASPFTLGLSSGAGVGIMLALYLAHLGGLSFVSSTDGMIPATVGSLATLSLIYVLGFRRGLLDPLSLVLAGVVISAVCGALIMLLQHLVPHGLRGDLVTWMMGHVPEQPSSRALGIVSGLSVGGLVMTLLLGPSMDVATFSDDEALTIGVSLGRLRAILLVASGVLTAGAVALAGPIAFVGLICPHAARILVGPRHAPLALAAAFLGVGLVVGADVLRQALDFGSGRMPVGIFTAILGGPAFLWLLKSGRGQS